MSKWRITAKNVLLTFGVFILLYGCAPPSSTTGQTTAQVATPTVKWEVELGDEVDTNLAAVDSVLYVTTDDYIYALDTLSGTLKWKSAVPGHLVSSPAVANGMVYFGASGFGDMDRRTTTVTAHALDAETGETRWQHELSHDRSDDSSNPIAVDGLVFFGTGWSDYSCCEFRGNGGHLAALDAATGKAVWQIDTIGHYGSGGAPTTTFAVANGLLYVASGYGGPREEDKRVRALDVKSGEQVWRSEVEGVFPIAESDGTLYVKAGGELINLDGKAGTVRWKWKPDPGSESLSNPVLVGDTTYVIGNVEREICFEPPCPPGKIYTDTLYALDSSSGKEKRKSEIPGGFFETRELIPIRSYLSYEYLNRTKDTERRYIKGVDQTDGKLRWEYEIGDYIFGSPAVNDGMLFVATNRGTIHALQVP